MRIEVGPLTARPVAVLYSVGTRRDAPRLEVAAFIERVHQSGSGSPV